MINLLRLTTLGAKIVKFILTYTAGTGGTISGLSSQVINKNKSGSQVTAVADEGYVFTGWSDSVVTAARTDMNIQANLSVNAIFELITPPSIVSIGNSIEWEA
jgi:cysteine synthase